jgi:hypothetical protein
MGSGQMLEKREVEPFLFNPFAMHKAHDSNTKENFLSSLRFTLCDLADCEKCKLLLDKLVVVKICGALGRALGSSEPK